MRQLQSQDQMLLWAIICDCVHVIAKARTGLRGSCGSNIARWAQLMDYPRIVTVACIFPLRVVRRAWRVSVRHWLPAVCKLKPPPVGDCHRARDYRRPSPKCRRSSYRVGALRHATPAGLSGLVPDSRKTRCDFWIRHHKRPRTLLVESAIDGQSALSPSDSGLFISTAGVAVRLPLKIVELDPKVILCGFGTDDAGDPAADARLAGKLMVTSKFTDVLMIK